MACQAQGGGEGEDGEGGVRACQIHEESWWLLLGTGCDSGLLRSFGVFFLAALAGRPPLRAFAIVHNHNHTQARGADFSSKVLPQHAGTSLGEALWPYMNPVQVTGVRVTAKEFNDAKKFGPHSGPYFLFTMKHEARDRPDRTKTRES